MRSATKDMGCREGLKRILNKENRTRGGERREKRKIVPPQAGLQHVQMIAEFSYLDNLHIAFIHSYFSFGRLLMVLLLMC